MLNLSFFEEPAILIRHDDSWNFGGFQIINILDGTSWIIFGTLLLFTISLLVIIDKIFVASSFFERLSIACLNISGVILGKGKFAFLIIFE